MVRLVVYLKEIGAKDAVQWLVSLVDKREVLELEAAGVPAACNGRVPGDHVPEVELKTAATAHFNEREAWLVGVIAQGVAGYLAETFKPLSDVSTIEKCIVAKVMMAAGMREGQYDMKC